ncbi:MAG: tyrosine-protein phosphatase [Pseudomonadota bacterium]
MRLILGPRPGKKSIDNIRSQGATHLVTLLSDREDAAASGRIAGKIGADWIHLPMDGGHMDKLALFDLDNAFRALTHAGALNKDATVYLHCSAGIHRTGFFAYALLRWRGASPDAARAQLAEIRQVTFDQVGEDRLALADKLLANIAL